VQSTDNNVWIPLCQQTFNAYPLAHIQLSRSTFRWFHMSILQTQWRCQMTHLSYTRLHKWRLLFHPQLHFHRVKGSHWEQLALYTLKYKNNIYCISEIVTSYTFYYQSLLMQLYTLKWRIISKNVCNAD